MKRLLQWCYALFVIGWGLWVAPVANAQITLRNPPPYTPSPATLDIPSGGFRGNQTFSFVTMWDNTDPCIHRVKATFQICEIDDVSDDCFTGMQVFDLPANSFNVTRNLRITLTAEQLDSANDFTEQSPLEFNPNFAQTRQ